VNLFPFFVGCDRSGTTLIQAVFDGHSRLAIPYESHFIPMLLRRRERYEREGGFDQDGFLADLFAYPFVERWGLTREEIATAIRKEPPGDVPNAIRTVFALYAARQNEPMYGDKTPGYVRSLPRIAGAFPEARFVHIIRDGRDVALSLFEAEWAPDSVVDAARFWKQRVEAGRTAGRVLGPARYSELRYEDFVDDPIGETQRVCAFLELSFEESMLDYSGRAEAIIGQTDVPHRHEGLREAPTKGRRDWRRQMEPGDVLLFEAVAGGTLADFGYARYAPLVPTEIARRARAQLTLRKVRGIPDRIRSEIRPRRRRLPPNP
jgi:hypothetical protein